MRIIITLFTLLIPVLLTGNDSTRLIILHTTDVHGSVNPYNYFEDKPASNGLAKVYEVVKKFRTEHKNVLLLDSGDLLQGTPMVYYFNHIENTLPNPMILTMNYMQYDAFTVGNHDIEQGSEVYLKAQRESAFPWLAANGISNDGQPFFEPYTIITRNGIKIGIIGLTTPAIPMWLDKRLYPDIEWYDMVTTAKSRAEQIRDSVDVMIGLFHAGMNADYSREQTEALGLPNENASLLVAQCVPGFDLILCGHSHRTYPYKKEDPQSVNGTLMVMSGSHARYLGVAELELIRNDAGWEIMHAESRQIKLDTGKASEEILELNKKYHEKTLAYIRKVIGKSEIGIAGKISRQQDNLLVELINRAQMSATGTTISFAASFNDKFFLSPGDIRIKDIYGMYRYENFLYSIEMTGQQIKDYLEYSARYLQYDRDNRRLKFNPDIPGYNFDMAEGIAYEFHIAKDIGDRIENLLDLKTGKPLIMDQTYRVAINSYRASGGGGHLAAAGIKQANILTKSNIEMRTILADYITSLNRITGPVDGNWRIVID